MTTPDGDEPLGDEPLGDVPLGDVPSAASARALVAEGYDAVYAGGADSHTLQDIWLRLACGTDFPVEFSHISFLTLAEAQRFARESGLAEGDRLVDLACGAGGPGLLVARDTGAALTGIDISEVGVTRAQARSRRVGLAESSAFRVGSFEDTGLPDHYADAAMTVDALQYSTDKRSALQEVARLLRPGGRLVFTAFEVEPANVEGYPVLGVDPVADYTPLLSEAGFAVDAYEETPGWLQRLTAAYQAVLDEPEALSGELGEKGYMSLSLEMSVTLGLEPYRRRVLGVATRR